MTVGPIPSASAPQANVSDGWPWPPNALQDWLPDWFSQAEASQAQTSPTQDSLVQGIAEILPGLRALQQAQQVHALEHATIWILSNHPEVVGLSKSPETSDLTDDSRFHGLSTARGFYLYGPTSTTRLDWSVKLALRQLKAGQAQLAIHPRCGTQVLARSLLTAGFVGASLALAPRRPLAQLAGIAGAIAAAAELSPTLGNWCQAHLTTAMPHNLEISKIHPTRDRAGNPAHFVALNWVALTV